MNSTSSAIARTFDQFLKHIADTCIEQNMILHQSGGVQAIQRAYTYCGEGQRSVVSVTDQDNSLLAVGFYMINPQNPEIDILSLLEDKAIHPRDLPQLVADKMRVIAQQFWDGKSDKFCVALSKIESINIGPTADESIDILTKIEDVHGLEFRRTE